jgi:hypothetical protein
MYRGRASGIYVSTCGAEHTQKSIFAPKRTGGSTRCQDNNFEDQSNQAHDLLVYQVMVFHDEGVSEVKAREID